MKTRMIGLLATTMLLGACAGEPRFDEPMSLGAPNFTTQASAQDAPVTRVGEPTLPAMRDATFPDQTIADRMLAASALERATGRAPDPASFFEVD